MSLNLNESSDVGYNGKSAASSTALATSLRKISLNTVVQEEQQLHDHSKGNLKCASAAFERKKLGKVPKTPTATPDLPLNYLDDDMTSVYSFTTTTSGRSTMSCEHPYVARNGTTYSGRLNTYLMHNSPYADKVGADYLTPTQRASREIGALRKALALAYQEADRKDSTIKRLSDEVIKLRSLKATLNSPEERSASSDAITVKENELKTSQDVSPIVDMVDEAAAKASPRHIQTQAQLSPHNSMQTSTEMQSSCADSGNFEDIITHSSSNSYRREIATQDVACGGDDTMEDEVSNASDNFELQRQELIRMYEQKIEELIRNQDSASSEMKRIHNDKMETLLLKLAECNTRYADIVHDYGEAKQHIRELEIQLENLQHKLVEHEDKQKKLYFHMYQKDQEAERLQRADQALEMAKRIPSNKVSVNELLIQLQSTQDELENIRASKECRNECGNNHALLTVKEAIYLWVCGARKIVYERLLEAQKNRKHVDPELTLQFLKCAIYYFLTDKENSQGHLQAIESILEFTDAEKKMISKARSSK